MALDSNHPQPFSESLLGSDPSAGTAVLEAIVEEKRTTPRQASELTASLARSGNAGAVQAVARDISEGGVFLTVAPSVGLAVGERCELELFESDGSPLMCLAGECCFATVVRTQTLPAGTAGPLLGAGLRFDHPLYL